MATSLFLGTTTRRCSRAHRDGARVCLRDGPIASCCAAPICSPLLLEFFEVGVVVVHGGVLPDGSCPREAALELRYVRPDGNRWRMVPRGKEKPGDRFWSEVWEGDHIVVYGHTPQRDPKIDRRAIGLDTGCVYGGKLTAAIFESPERWTLADVPARRAYSR